MPKINGRGASLVSSWCGSVLTGVEPVLTGAKPVSTCADRCRPVSSLVSTWSDWCRPVSTGVGSADDRNGHLTGASRVRCDCDAATGLAQLSSQKLSKMQVG